MNQYFTITAHCEGLYKEKGSKFIAFGYPVQSEEEIEERLTEVRKKFHDARHHCYAWIIGKDQQKWRVNDDGEPSHSAGDPILGQIRSLGLTNVLVVVVRYFGGTKLGVGGLISAYKEAAAAALEKGRKVEIFEEVEVELLFPYSLLSVVERLISDLEISDVDRDFQQDCRIKGRMKKDLESALKNKTAELYNLSLSITHLE